MQDGETTSPTLAETKALRDTIIRMEPVEKLLLCLWLEEMVARLEPQLRGEFNMPHSVMDTALDLPTEPATSVGEPMTVQEFGQMVGEVQEGLRRDGKLPPEPGYGGPGSSHPESRTLPHRPWESTQPNPYYRVEPSEGK